MNYEFNIFYYLNLLKKWGKQIIIVVIAAMLAAGTLAFLKSTAYSSTVTILLTGEGSGGASSIAGSSLGRILGMSDIAASSRDLIIAILTSRRMAKDIREYFEYDKKPFRWSIDTYAITGGLAVEVKGPDPAITEKIANFCIENLNKINKELVLTTNPQMVKVLDAASHGAPEDKKVAVKTTVAGIMSFLIFCLYIFVMDYVRKLRP